MLHLQDRLEYSHMDELALVGQGNSRRIPAIKEEMIYPILFRRFEISPNDQYNNRFSMESCRESMKAQ